MGHAQEESMKTLASIGKDYIALVHEMGNKENGSYEKRVLSLCTPDCKKIVNGAVWYEGAKNFVPQLVSTKEKVGLWTMETLDIIPGKDDRTVVVRFIVRTEKAGIWNTLVILRCNDQLLIEEINEIFNSYEGS